MSNPETAVKQEGSTKILVFRLLLSVVAFVAAGVLFYRLPFSSDSVSPTSVAVEIHTAPAGALVFIDGRLTEHTPCTIELKSGDSRAVTLRHDGYREVNHLLTSAAGPRVDFELEQVPVGGLKVTSFPSGAAVFLEDTFLGKTPLESKRIPSGRYLLRFTRANYNARIEAVEIRPDDHAKVHAVLESKVESFYKTAIAAEPGNIPFRTELAHYYLITERKDDCIAEYSRAFEMAGNLAAEDGKTISDVGRLLNEIKKIKYEHADIVKALMPSIEAM
ncbi:PEGA domain-containing protein, partial [Planctomycetota bacterium]